MKLLFALEIDTESIFGEKFFSGHGRPEPLWERPGQGMASTANLNETLRNQHCKPMAARAAVAASKIIALVW